MLSIWLRIVFILEAILMAIVPFYRVDFPTSCLPDSFEYADYRNGLRLETHVINRDVGPEYVALKSLVFKERRGWRYDLRDYANSKVFSSSKMIINCMRSGIVARYQDSYGVWRQISKSVKEVCPEVGQTTHSSPHDK